MLALPTVLALFCAYTPAAELALPCVLALPADLVLPLSIATEPTMVVLTAGDLVLSRFQDPSPIDVLLLAGLVESAEPFGIVLSMLREPSEDQVGDLPLVLVVPEGGDRVIPLFVLISELGASARVESAPMLVLPACQLHGSSPLWV